LITVDWEERIDVKRMRTERLEKAKAALKKSGVDAWNQALVDMLPQLFPKAKLVDGQKIMLEARKTKTIDEINHFKLNPLTLPLSPRGRGAG